jgi:formate hydrogenlyase subunit 3/multisubunit Na+/H+ antiporter MnhD subunit
MILLSIEFTNTNTSFLKINYLLNFVIEPVGCILGIISSSLWFITNLYSRSYLKFNPEINTKKFYIFISLAIFCTILIAFSNNLLMLFITYEFLTLFTYPLVANTGTYHEQKSARFYLYFLLITSLTLFLPVIAYINLNGISEFSIGGFANSNFGLQTTLILAILVLYGTAKAAIVPMHFWLPKAMVAPIPVSAVLHAVAVVKSGIVIILKFMIYGFGLDYLAKSVQNFSADYNLITILASISVIVSSIAAIKQQTIKKLLAYSTVNQLSLCLLIASMLTPFAIQASLLLIISHALAKITLFLVAGYLYCNTKITNIEDFSGLGKKMPLTMGIFTIAALSIIGLPILGGFISKAYALKAALINMDIAVIVVIIISILFSSYYFIRIIHLVYFGKFQNPKRVVYNEELSSTMLQSILITSCMLVLMGFYLDYFINIIERISYEYVFKN